MVARLNGRSNLRVKSRFGFTLIELMVSISIIAILASIFMPNMIRGRFKAYHSGCIQGLGAIRTALESYRVDNPDYPSALNTLSGSKYIATLPTCPSVPGQVYNYQTTPDLKAYTVSCPGAHYLQLPNAVRQGYPQLDSTATIIQQ
jgi:prepilin-type N-terminal cleavage/methylation domain-containing protein